MASTGGTAASTVSWSKSCRSGIARATIPSIDGVTERQTRPAAPPDRDPSDGRLARGGRGDRGRDRAVPPRHRAAAGAERRGRGGSADRARVRDRRGPQPAAVADRPAAAAGQLRALPNTVKPGDFTVYSGFGQGRRVAPFDLSPPRRPAGNGTSFA